MQRAHVRNGVGLPVPSLCNACPHGWVTPPLQPIVILLQQDGQKRTKSIRFLHVIYTKGWIPASIGVELVTPTSVASSAASCT